ncbi:MAG TPA: salicylate synthase [Pilimelia sp.]|nr:salicylate synthase [Pilimelia sp.]
MHSKPDVTAPPATPTYDEIDGVFTGDPLSAAARVVETITEPYVLYESGGRYSIGIGSLAEIRVDTTAAVLTTRDGEQHTLPWSGAPLDRVTELLDKLGGLGLAEWRAYGWAGFELAYANAGRTDLLCDHPLLHLMIPHTEVTLEPGRATVRSTHPDETRRIGGLLAGDIPERRYQPRPVDVVGGDRERYCDAVAAAVQEIEDRKLQKVILSRVLPVERPVDLVGTYVVGRRCNTPARSFLLDAGGVRAAGFSPEIVVEVGPSGLVRTQPLAGTRALAGIAEHDLDRRSDLLSDAKEIFEHAISVKVAYDELVELCGTDSVRVDNFMTVKERGSVQHLASSVTGQLPAGVGPWRAFEALFPAVTASGVPKTDAYAAIHRHETLPRGLYSGAVFAVDHTGAMDAALVLRSIFQQGGRTWLRAGAGIVAQSRPAREFEETCEKLRSIAMHVVPLEGTAGATAPAR